MIKLFIIADDLTGAIDTGVQLAKQGIGTVVAPYMSSNLSDQIRNCPCEVIIFNTESRHIDPIEAAGRIRRILKLGKKAGVQHYFKKTDSTMRGNIGAELEAFLKESDQNAILFVPAHPRLKRFTIHGLHYIGETLLHETEFAKDPLEPIEMSFIPELLRIQTKLPVHLMEPRSLEHVKLKPGIYVPDCRSESDLNLIGQFALNHHLAGFLSGSAALAEYLPQLLDLGKQSAQVNQLRSPLLLINGSMNSISHGQVSNAVKHDWHGLPLAQDLLSNSELAFSAYRKNITNQLQQHYEQQQNVILSTVELDVQSDTSKQASAQIANEHFDLVAHRIGALVVDILNEIPYQTLIVFGGDTSLGIMKALGCQSIEPIDELLPGVALSIARLETSSFFLITKPGGYGEEDEILKINDYIRKQKL